MIRRYLIIAAASMLMINIGVHASPVKSAIGALGSRFADKIPSFNNPYIQDGLVGMWFAEDFNGTSIPARFGKNAPPLVMVQSSAGTIVPTARGFTTEGAKISFTTATIPSVVNVFNEFSYGREGEVTFEHLADWTNLYGIPNTIYGDVCCRYGTSDSVSTVGNTQWVMMWMDHNLNTTQTYFVPALTTSFLISSIVFPNEVRKYLPEYLATTMSNPLGMSIHRHLWGYSSSYKQKNTSAFYARAYNADTRNRFIKNSYLEVYVRPSEEFLRCSIYLRALTDEELEHNREVDSQIFGL